MKTDLIARPTDTADRDLLVSVNRWFRENGWISGWWYHSRMSPGRDVAVEWAANYIHISTRDNGGVFWRADGDRYLVKSVRQAVDMLVVLGVLPVEFSSAYAAGRDSILAGAR